MSIGFHVFASNRMECLAANLASMLEHPPATPPVHPLRRQTVVVQSKGMQRWISMEVARINGICANIEFPFPNAFLESLYTRLIGPLPQSKHFEPQALTLTILHRLPDLLQSPEFGPLRRYLADPHRPLKLYQLARKIADTLDQYVVFRPDLLSAWEKNKSLPASNPHAAWQAALWRTLLDSTPAPHRALVQQRLVQRLSNPDISLTAEQLPIRLFVFGISHLPPFHLQVLEALAQRIPVCVFVLNPCRHYWFDLVSNQQMIRLRSQHGKEPDALEKLHLDRGNRLLSSLGHLGKYFFERIYQLQIESGEEYFDNPAHTVLGRIQQDLLDLVDRQSDSQAESQTFKNDGTVRVHSCHSPMREVEVLHDQLLDLLEKNPSLEPRDILVMTPDIVSYSPYVHAVFGTTEDARCKLPFSIADQNLAHESKMIESFISLLDLRQRRLEASRVMMLLEYEAVYRQFGFVAADLPLAEKWISNTGIRWGWDAADRRRNHLPGFRENSWRQGLDCLVLGYAMGSEAELFGGALPYGGIGAGEGPILGRLADFAEALHDSLEQLSSSDTLKGWQIKLHSVLARMFKPDDRTEDELKILKGLIDQLQPAGLSCEQPLELEVIRQYIKDEAGKISADSGFISGGITFCAMLPMRSIPAQVICLLGMNHDSYPREQHDPGFNLIAEEPRSGDRSRRNDDRYLFLEALLSARKIFYMSYVGQCIQDNSPIPPSVLVDELVEYITENMGIDGRQLVLRHPLQGFSSYYFNGQDPQLFSYSKENCAAVQQLSSQRRSPCFFSETMPPMGDEWRRCEWKELASFWSHPVRYFCEQRLGIYLQAQIATIEDRENFVLDPLTRHTIGQQLLGSRLKGTPADRMYKTLCASGILPHGTAGKVLFQEISSKVHLFHNRTASILAGEKARSATLELKIRPYTLHGHIDHLYGHARIVTRLGDTRAGDLIRAFLFHLALLAAPREGLPQVTFLICQDAVWHIGNIAGDPVEILHTFMDRYWQGLHRPLPFFQRTSYAFARQTIVRQQPRKTALAQAVQKWRGNDYLPGESSDPYHRRCFGDTDPLAAEFENLALRIYTPILSACSMLDLEG